VRLYQGQIWLGAAIVAFLLGVFWALMLFVFETDDRSELTWFLMFIAWIISMVAMLVFATTAYGTWVPKWERHEKRTGHVPGEKEGKQ
jgi:ABC-type amino acid transport system permease subunit